MCCDASSSRKLETRCSVALGNLSRNPDNQSSHPSLPPPPPAAWAQEAAKHYSAALDVVSEQASGFDGDAAVRAAAEVPATPSAPVCSGFRI